MVLGPEDGEQETEEENNQTKAHQANDYKNKHTHPLISISSINAPQDTGVEITIPTALEMK